MGLSEQAWFITTPKKILKS